MAEDSCSHLEAITEIKRLNDHGPGQNHPPLTSAVQMVRVRASVSLNHL